MYEAASWELNGKLYNGQQWMSSPKFTDQLSSNQSGTDIYPRWSIQYEVYSINYSCLVEPKSNQVFRTNAHAFRDVCQMYQQNDMT